MSEIKENEFIRSKDGVILKALEYDKVLDMCLCTDNKYKGYIEPEDIVKHSHDIKDLIEVGDILEIEVDNETIIVGFKDDNVGFYNELLDKAKRKEIKILKILTHEQFTQNCYEVKE